MLHIFAVIASKSLRVCGDSDLEDQRIRVNVRLVVQFTVNNDALPVLNQPIIGMISALNNLSDITDKRSLTASWLGGSRRSSPSRRRQRRLPS